jgi:hypothetical protein
LLERHAAAFANHDLHVPHILSLRPVAGIIHQKWIELIGFDSGFQASRFVAAHAPQAHRVGLAQNQEDLDGLRHVGRFPSGFGSSEAPWDEVAKSMHPKNAALDVWRIDMMFPLTETRIRFLQKANGFRLSQSEAKPQPKT